VAGQSKNSYTVQGLANLHRVHVPAATAAPDLDPASTGQSASVAPSTRTDERDLSSLHLGIQSDLMGTPKDLHLHRTDCGVKCPVAGSV